MFQFEDKVEAQENKHGHQGQECREQQDAFDQVPPQQCEYAPLQSTARTINARMFAERAGALVRFKPRNDLQKHEAVFLFVFFLDQVEGRSCFEPLYLFVIIGVVHSEFIYAPIRMVQHHLQRVAG